MKLYFYVKVAHPLQKVEKLDFVKIRKSMFSDVKIIVEFISGIRF